MIETNKPKFCVFGNDIITLKAVKTFLQLGHPVLLIHSKSLALPSWNNALFKHARFTSFDDPLLVQKIETFQPDYIFTVLFDLKLPVPIWQLAKEMAFNFHPSLLPEYRSQDPWFWIIKNNETKTGITIHQITNYLLAGPIYFQFPFPLTQEDTAGTYYEKISELAPAVLKTFIEMLDRGNMKSLPQNQSKNPPKKPYYPVKKQEDRIIKWDTTAEEIDALIRACNPSPGATTYYKSSPIKILESSVTPFESEKPGRIQVIDEEIYVDTTTTQIRLEVLARDRFGVFSGIKFANIFNIEDGTLLSSHS